MRENKKLYSLRSNFMSYENEYRRRNHRFIAPLCRNRIRIRETTINTTAERERKIHVKIDVPLLSSPRINPLFLVEIFLVKLETIFLSSIIAIPKESDSSRRDIGFRCRNFGEETRSKGGEGVENKRIGGCCRFGNSRRQCFGRRRRRGNAIPRWHTSVTQGIT